MLFQNYDLPIADNFFDFIFIFAVEFLHHDCITDWTRKCDFYKDNKPQIKPNFIIELLLTSCGDIFRNC